jgi:hypothetical protein
MQRFASRQSGLKIASMAALFKKKFALPEWMPRK